MHGPEDHINGFAGGALGITIVPMLLGTRFILS